LPDGEKKCTRVQGIKINGIGTGGFLQEVFITLNGLGTPCLRPCTALELAALSIYLSPVCVAVTECYRMGNLLRNLFLAVLGAGSPFPRGHHLARAFMLCHSMAQSRRVREQEVAKLTFVTTHSLCNSLTLMIMALTQS
jgi:hypothetical protein